MSYRTAKPAMLIVAFAVAVTASSAAATPSTSQGLISVAQVNEMLEKAQTDGTARQVLTAYLAGVGEAVSAATAMNQTACQTSLSLNADNARQALRASRRDPAQTPATSLIVRDMLNRAGCRR